ncbi:Sulfotransferase domain-containing protein [Fodinibius roseus]|uniref:Sulfotransferase domain-containing protein n=1 Tax=Fodinibius roseus TaxID=1194090 RepID=A0A1M4SNU6_9BACT|nr:sulfotransferase domain-containing protein [Fodinibius roseus]SHE33900.1 Sulfotransferase domain-containing protein [Fodinibius roseus]
METRKSTYSQVSQTYRIHPVVVFLCTPRCGTQWLQKNLSEVYAGEAIVLHEPVGKGYRPKVNLGRYHSPVEPEDNSTLHKHLDFIEDTTDHMNYIEIGWPSIAGVPELYRQFRGNLKLVHLYRNPIKVAASMVTHNWYTGKIRDRFENLELNPFDESALLSEYKESWEGLTLFEKALYYWTEINLRAREIQYRFPNIPFYSLKFENLFEENKEIRRITLLELLSFMGLGYDGKILEATEIPYDRHHHKATVEIDWKDIYAHPQTIELANKLGYRFDTKMDLRRYNGSLYRQIISRIKSVLDRIVGNHKT